MAAGTDKSKVRVAVVGDASQLERELKKAEAQLGGFGANAKKSGDILRSALFGGAVLYGAKQLVDAAGNLQQSSEEPPPYSKTLPDRSVSSLKKPQTL
jgi:hypothetical protein